MWANHTLRKLYWITQLTLTNATQMEELSKLKWKGSPELSKLMFFFVSLKQPLTPPHTTNREETDNSAYILLKDVREHLGSTTL